MTFAALVATCRRNAQGFINARDANVAILTALMTPILLVTMLGGVGVSVAMSKRRELVEIAQIACNRALKPTRMKILNDTDRTRRATTNFDALALDRQLTITSRTVTSGWLTAQVQASATIPAIGNLGTDKANATVTAISFPVSVDVKCEGIPPFPKIGDTILTSNFARPDGEGLPMKYGTWGVYKATEFGWEGGSGPGVEIQDWYAMGWSVYLPQVSKSRYVVELDSDANSSMYRTIELHKGTYRFSFWYYGRDANPATNTISVYLEGVRPVSAKVKKLSVSRPKSDGWRYEQFDIPVDTYSLYRLTIAAEGISDSFGGNFNDLKLEYIKRPG